MPNINRVFTGGLNLDDHPYRVPENAYTDALNITRDSQGEGQDGVAATILGNTSISNSLPAGQNKIIGGYPDKLRNRYYFFNWNSNGKSGIYYYSQNTNVITKILESETDSGGIDILNFNPSYKIFGVNIIYRDDSEGDLLFFNDGLNEPRVINVTDSYVTWLPEYLSVAKAPPQMPAKVTYENDDENNDITTNILSGSKTIDQNLFEGGIQTDYVSIESIVSGSFTLGGGNTELTYTGAAGTVDFVLSFGFTYNFTPGTATIRVTKNGTPITGTSQNVSAGFGGFTYNQSLSESLATNDILRIEVVITDAISYPTEFFICSGGTISASITTSNPQVSVNNLRNALFQFRYRFRFANFEKSVWSTASIVPLPNQNSLNLTDNDFTKNCRISVSMSTGGLDVTHIELEARQTKDGVTTDWFFIKAFGKSELSISNNDIYTYKFYNDGLYSTADVLENALLFDYVPQKANAQEMVNGNTPIYGGITEGYDEITTDLNVSVEQNTTGFFTDYCGLAFFAQAQGLDSGSEGTTMKVYVYGTGTNTNNVVTTLNNSAGNYVINAIDSNGNQIGVDVTNNTVSTLVSTLLGNISTALQANGWTQVSLVGNILTVSFLGGFTLLSSGVKYLAPVGTPENTKFAYPFESGLEYAVQYFDDRGRTNGALTNISATFNTDEKTTADFPQTRLQISHRPPTWAKYYQVLRSNNTTYGKRLTWVTVSAYSNVDNSNSNYQFAYLGISNIEYYNELIGATQGVISYSFQQGDRVRILSRFDEDNVQTSLTIVDYEVLGTENDPIINGIPKPGRYVKIKYPTADINSGMRFDGTADYQHYEILLYSYISVQSAELKPFFEFGHCYGIGNAGTNNAYHMGLNQTQSADLVTPALIDLVNGDLFYRKRNVPIGAQYSFNSGLFNSNQQYVSFQIQVPSSPVVVGSSYRLATQGVAIAGLDAATYPTNANVDNIFQNNTASTISVRFRGTFSAYADIPAGVQLIAKLTNSGGTTNTPISKTFSLPNGNTGYEFTFDGTVSVPANNKLWVLLYLTGQTATAPVVNIGQFFMQIDVQQTAQIEVIELSFSDVYNLVTNSNGRASTVEENAKQTYYPTLVRFGQSYQADTSINNTNRFYPENFDTYDRGFGDIMRLHVRDRYMKVYQKLKVGNVPVLTQIVKDVAGNPLQANSDQLINKIQYYSGDYGIGDSPSSLAWDNFADYFVDDFRGVVCRLSQDGITPISIVYKTNSFFTRYTKAYRTSLNNGIAPAGQTYEGNPTIYGAFDAFTNKYIVALEPITRYSDPNTISFQQEGFTISFDEVLNQWESFYSYKPEWFGCLNTLLISFKDGELWKHNSTTYCNFYSTQYEANVEVVFNNFSPLKKTFKSVTEYANTAWDCPQITTQMNTYGGTPQSSMLFEANFRVLESNYHSNFLRDANSSGSLINGSELKGNYMVIKFRKNNANQYYFLNLVSVNFIDSPLNKS